MSLRTEAILRSVPDEQWRGLVETRRDLHRHPELAFAEHRTAALIAERLRRAGLAPRTGVGKTGITADFGTGEGIVLIRSDMDGLPIEEANDVPYRSIEKGRMHACGHDGHVAIGLAVAERLASRPPRGRIRSLFQPAEEGANGALAMTDDGALDQVRAALGLHLWNQIPTGTVGVARGPMMAAVDEFEIVVRGKGGHGAAPHETIDVVLAAARIVEALQSIVSREISPLQSAVVTVGRIAGGNAFNAIPESVSLLGTVRSFDAEVWRSLPEKMERIVKGIAAACGASHHIDYRRLSRAVVNDTRITSLLVDTASELLGEENVDTDVRTMGGEDMSVYLERVPGCFFFVGSAPAGGHRPHHSPFFDIDERSLAIGTLVLEAAARRAAEELEP
jgi:amidohydrolase